MEIRCKKGDCHYNTGCSCCASSIEIGRSAAECMSYFKDEIKEGLIIENGNIFQVAEELVAKNTKNVPLECHKGNCIYNRKEQCTANGITVIDSDCEGHTVAECATFVEGEN